MGGEIAPNYNVIANDGTMQRDAQISFKKVNDAPQ